MKKTILLFLLVILTLLYPHLVNAAPKIVKDDFIEKVTIPGGIEVEDLKFVDNQIILAGTNGDGLWASYNAGTNWSKLSTWDENYRDVKDIFIVNSKIIYTACGKDGIIYTLDGKTWEQSLKGIENQYVTSVTRMDNGLLLAGTRTHGVFVSRDNAKTWVRTDRGLTFDHITSLIVMKKIGFIIAGTYGGGFYVSQDSSKTWIKSNTNLTNLFINDLAINSGGHVYAATNGAGVMFTPNGITWHTFSNKYHHWSSSNLTPLPDSSITSVAFSGTEIFMGTRSKGLFYWNDLWNAWESTGVRTVGVSSCAASADGTIIGVLGNTSVIRSTDGGIQWNYIGNENQSIAVDVYKHYSITDDTYKFVDIFTSNYTNILYSYKNAYPANNSKKLYKSTDNGHSWTYISTINDYIIKDIKFSNEKDVFILTKNGLLISNDGGATISSVFINQTKAAANSHYLNVEYDVANNILALGYQYLELTKEMPPTLIENTNILYYSTNKGISWQEKAHNDQLISYMTFSPLLNKWSLVIGDSIFTSTTGITSLSATYAAKPHIIIDKYDNYFSYELSTINNHSHKIYQSKNKGKSWSQIQFAPEYYDPENGWDFKGMYVVGTTDLYIYSEMRLPNVEGRKDLYYSSDFGAHWEKANNCFNMSKVREIKADNIGSTFILTNSLYKSFDSLSLNAPKLITPENNTRGVSRNPIFVWNQSPNAEEYEFQIDQTDLFNAPFETNVTGDTSIVLTLDLTPNKDYYYRVRSKTHYAKSEWAVRTFTVGLEAPILMSPKNLTKGVEHQVPLKWHSIKGATYYNIEIATDSSFTNLVWHKENNIDTTVITSKILGSTVYYWRVKAFTAKNVSIWSEIWSFRTLMGSPLLLSPANDTVNMPLSLDLVWKSVDDADQFLVQIAKDIEFTDKIFDDISNNDTSHTLSGLEPEITYYWRVASKNNDGVSEYSDPWNFSTMLKPVELIAPENYDVNLPITTIFTWEEHHASQTYNLQIAEDAKFTKLIIDSTVTNSFEATTNRIKHNKEYYWRVRVKVDDYFGLWSEERQFVTGIKTPLLIYPDNGKTGLEQQIDFTWSVVEGAKYYQLQVSKNSTFTDLVFSKDSLTGSYYKVIDLEPETKYYWRVRVWNDNSYGTAQWSEYWMFETGELVMSLRSPKTGSKSIDIPATLTWFLLNELKYYHLQVSDKEDFSNLIVDKDSLTEGIYIVPKEKLNTMTDYWWKVQGISKNYKTEWSQVWKFTTGATGIEDISSKIQISPNPANKYITLELCDLTGISSIIIYNSTGKRFANISNDTLINNSLMIETENYPNGVYYLLIQTKDNLISKEFVIIR